MKNATLVVRERERSFLTKDLKGIFLKKIALKPKPSKTLNFEQVGEGGNSGKGILMVWAKPQK